MKILFISYLSQPSNRIGAVRPSNLVRWLAEFGHEVTLITANPEAVEASGEASVHPVVHSALIQKGMQKLALRTQMRKEAGVKPHSYVSAVSAETKKRRFTKEYFYTVRLWLWTWLCQWDWTLRSRCYMKKNLTKDYDVVVSSFGPLGSLYAGCWARKKKYAKAWIADFRDPVEQDLQPGVIRFYSRCLEKRALHLCDRLLTVSEGESEHFRSLTNNVKLAEKITLLENGFECGTVVNEAPADEVLRIVYTGQLYEGRQDFGPLFYAVADLISNGELPQGCVEIHYAGPHDREFLARAEECGAIACVRSHGMLAREDAVSLQGRADVLCVLSWNTENSQGILTGKFFEYLRASKPILAVLTGAVPEAELTRRVRNMNLGFSYESACREKDDPRLREWLKSAWTQKKNHGKVDYDPVWAQVVKYRYDGRAKLLAMFCEDVLEARGGKI